MPSIRSGFYLIDKPPRRQQWSTSGRSLKPVVVVHTAESGNDLTGSDERAENVANFIRTRTGAGSYHYIGDRDSIIPMIPPAYQAFGDGTGSNRFAIHISLAMNANIWPSLSKTHRDQYVETAAHMAHMAGLYFKSKGLGMPRPVRLSKAASNAATASGFISHANRDPARRSDPGRGFPWQQFLTRYQQLATGQPAGAGIGSTGTIKTVDYRVRELQAIIGAYQDNLFGPETERKLRALPWFGYAKKFDQTVAARLTSRHSVIGWLQKWISAEPQFNLQPDGIFGSATHETVKKYFGHEGIVAGDSLIWVCIK